MDEDVSIINTNTRNEKIKNFLLKNKNILILIILALILILVGVYGFDKYKTNKKKEISEKFNLATIDYSKNTKDKTVNSLIEVMYTLGKKIGVAREINQDLNSIWCQSKQDEHAMSEVLNKKKLVPVVHAFENAKISQKRKLGDIYFKRVLDPKDLGDIQEVLEEVGSKTY